MAKDRTIKHDPAAAPGVPPEQTQPPVQADTAPTEPAPAPEPDPAAQLAAQVEELTRQRDDYLDMAQRIQAEFDNYRRRNRDAQQEAMTGGLAQALAAMVPVLDNLERAAGAACDAQAGIRDGIEMVLRQMQDAVAALGLAEIPARRQCFDPALHNAVMQGEPEEDCPAGSVLEVFQKGYRLGDRVIRHSMVKVAK